MRLYDDGPRVAGVTARLCKRARCRFHTPPLGCCADRPGRIIGMLSHPDASGEATEIIVPPCIDGRGLVRPAFRPITDMTVVWIGEPIPLPTRQVAAPAEILFAAQGADPIGVIPPPRKWRTPLGALALLYELEHDNDYESGHPIISAPAPTGDDVDPAGLGAQADLGGSDAPPTPPTSAPLSSRDQGDPATKTIPGPPSVRSPWSLFPITPDAGAAMDFASTSSTDLAAPSRAIPDLFSAAMDLGRRAMRRVIGPSAPMASDSPSVYLIYVLMCLLAICFWLIYR